LKENQVIWKREWYLQIRIYNTYIN